MLKHNLGYPRIGKIRELKKGCEHYWLNKIDHNTLLKVGKKIRIDNWITQNYYNLDLIPCNDFSFYDHVLDISLLFGVIPESFSNISFDQELDLYFSMARGIQKNNLDIKAMEMTKWFNTNYHYIVPEFNKDQKFCIKSNKIFNEVEELKNLLTNTKKIKPVLIGPVSYLFLGKAKNNEFSKMDLIGNLVDQYISIIDKLVKKGIKWIQLDEPILGLDINEEVQESVQYAYENITRYSSKINILLTSYFEDIVDKFPILEKFINYIKGLHIDLIEAPNQLDNVLSFLKDKTKNTMISLGIIDGRNIWKNEYKESIEKINKAIKKLGEERIMIAPNCSLIHVPIDVEQEILIPNDIKNRLSFAKQKLYELNNLDNIIKYRKKFDECNINIKEKKNNNIFKNIDIDDINRKNNFIYRQKKQKNKFKFPLFPTTTIGSFPQTNELRKIRNKFRNKKIDIQEYNNKIKELISNVIKEQEEIGLDVLVHGEFERNDMVEYFAEHLEGMIQTKNGWIQSYGSRCVKPPIIYGDVKRKKNITVEWICYAQSKTKKIVKGMLTGPVTILQWSFTRNDQHYSETAYQIAWAIREETLALEKNGIKIIQIDEPALREGLPLKKKNWNFYFDWAIKSFKISSSGVKDETQIHTHMCYSEFNEIFKKISYLDADVITLETSRSKMELLKAFSQFHYPNEIGPGVYDIHSPRIPSVQEIFKLIKKSTKYLSVDNIWINPDCGLKTRRWQEVKQSLKNMILAAKMARRTLI